MWLLPPFQWMILLLSLQVLICDNGWGCCVNFLHWNSLFWKAAITIEILVKKDQLVFVKEVKKESMCCCFAMGPLVDLQKGTITWKKLSNCVAQRLHFCIILAITPPLKNILHLIWITYTAAKMHIFEAHRFQNMGHDLISHFTMPSTGARYFGVVQPLLKAMQRGV